MRSYHAALIVILATLPLLSQTPDSAVQVQDSQQQEKSAQNTDARLLITQALLAAGGQARVTAVKDFLAHGAITTGSGTKTGQVTLEGRGDDQFRMDSDIEGRADSWAVNHGNGQFKNSLHNRVDAIASYNAANQGWLTLPSMRISAALEDPRVEFKSLAPQSINGMDTYRIRVIRHFPQEQDPKDLLAGLCTTDYYLSTSDLRILRMEDSVHPNQAAVGMDSYGHVVIRRIPRAIFYADFRTVDGVLVPFSVTETIASQQIWSIQLSDIVFNTGPNEADFSLQ